MVRVYLIIAIIALSVIILAWQYRTDIYIWLIARQVDQSLSDQQKIDYVRQLINRNTTHLPQNSDPANVKDQYRLLRGIYRSEYGNGEKVPTTCGPSAEAMAAILDNLGYQTRIIHSFSGKQDVILSHTYLEAWAGKWQLQDPYYDIYYVTGDGDIASATDVLMGRATVHNGRNGRMMIDGPLAIALEDIYEVAMYDYRDRGEPPVIVVNPAKFDMGKVFTGNGNEPFGRGKTFREFATDLYGPVIWETGR